MIIKIKMRKPKDIVRSVMYFGEPKLFLAHDPNKSIGQVVEIEEICGDLIYTIQIFPEKIKELGDLTK